MIELFPAKCCNEILRCGSSVWVGIVMKNHNTPTKHATLLILDRTMLFLKCVTADNTCVICWALRQELHKQNVFSVTKHCAHDLASWNDLFEFCLHWWWCVPPLHGLLLNSGVTCDTHVSSPVTKRLKKSSPYSLYRVRKVNALTCCFILWSSISIFGTQTYFDFLPSSGCNKIINIFIVWRYTRPKYIVMDITIARQRFGNYIPTATNINE
jgi:hypothetical protein